MRRGFEVYPRKGKSARAYHEKTCREAGFFAVRRGFEVYPREGKSARAYHKKPAVRQVFCCAPRIRGLSPRREIRSGVPQKNPVVSIATGFFFAIAAVKNQAQFRLFSAIKCPVMLHQKLTSPGSEMHRPQGFAGLEESRCSRRRQRLLHPRAYPSATSSVIITLKPTAKKTVPRLECFPWDISGISSSTTT